MKRIKWFIQLNFYSVETFTHILTCKRVNCMQDDEKDFARTL